VLKKGIIGLLISIVVFLAFMLFQVKEVDGDGFYQDTLYQESFNRVANYNKKNNSLELGESKFYLDTVMGNSTLLSGKVGK
jgi:hypothetical protein